MPPGLLRLSLRVGSASRPYRQRSEFEMLERVAIHGQRAQSQEAPEPFQEVAHMASGSGRRLKLGKTERRREGGWSEFHGDGVWIGARMLLGHAGGQRIDNSAADNVTQIRVTRQKTNSCGANSLSKSRCSARTSGHLAKIAKSLSSLRENSRNTNAIMKPEKNVKLSRFCRFTSADLDQYIYKLICLAYLASQDWMPENAKSIFIETKSASKY